MRTEEERLTARLVVLLPPSAHRELKRRALEKETDVSTLVRKSILNKDGRLKL